MNLCLYLCKYLTIYINIYIEIYIYISIYLSICQKFLFSKEDIKLSQTVVIFQFLPSL